MSSAARGPGRRERHFRVLLSGCTVIAVAAICWRFGWSADVPAYLYLVAVGAVVSFTDVTAGRILNRVILPSYPIALALLAISSASGGQWGSYAQAAIAMTISLALYLVLSCLPGGMGFGDVKLAGILGLFLGYLGWSVYVSGLFAGFLVGALTVLVLRVVHHSAADSTIPFAPCMVAGTIVAVVLLR